VSTYHRNNSAASATTVQQFSNGIHFSFLRLLALFSIMFERDLKVHHTAVD